MQVIEIGSLAISALLVARFGATMLAAHQIILQYFWLYITLIMAMSQAITIRVGHAIGKNNSGDLYYTIITGLVMGILFTLGIVFLLEYFPGTLLSLDIDINDPDNKSLLQYCYQLFAVVGVLLFFESIRISGFGCLRGLKDTRYPMVVSLYSFWIIGLVSVYVLANYYQMHLIGVWLGLGIGMLFGSIAILCRIIRSMKSALLLQKI